MSQHIKEIRINGFKKFTRIAVKLNEKTNILVGSNESGKSTILEAIKIVLNQQYINYDKYIVKELLNIDEVTEFKANPSVENLPKIKIEIDLNLDTASIINAEFLGINNSDGHEKYGITFDCAFDDEFLNYQEIIDEILKGVIPFEYYKMTWTKYNGRPYHFAQKPIKLVSIDNSESNTSTSFNTFNKSLFESVHDIPKQMNARHNFREKISSIFDDLSLEILSDGQKFGVNNKKIIFDNLISIYENEIPLENKGKGIENIIKTKISINKHSNLDLILLEEPENHLCHSNLLKMLEEIELEQENTQIIITTHNNMIASKLNLKNILWLSDNEITSLNSIDDETALFFEKADNNNFLTALLSKKIILVEGSSEYILLPKLYYQKYDKKIGLDSITIISCNGITYNNYLKALKNKDDKIAVITDNDGKQNVIDKASEFNSQNDKKHIFVGNNIDTNWTFEPCLYYKNVALIEREVTVTPSATYFTSTSSNINHQNLPVHLRKMLSNSNKSNIALQLSQLDDKIEVPDYIEEAFVWLNE